MAGNQGPPDLAKILQALQGGTQTPQPQPQLQPQLHPQPQRNDSLAQLLRSLQPETSTSHDTPPNEYDPLQYYTQSRLPAPLTLQNNDSNLPSKITHREQPKNPQIDPHTILTWPSALRHITRLVARKPEVVERVKKLKQSQRDHESEWWDGRQGLLKQQNERGVGRKEIEAVLRSVGGHVNSSVQGPTPEEDAAELLRFDMKVHRALTEMESSFKAELAGLGVPFFGTKGELVLNEELASSNPPGTATTASELEALQKRMLDLLVDLCED